MKQVKKRVKIGGSDPRKARIFTRFEALAVKWGKTLVFLPKKVQTFLLVVNKSRISVILGGKWRGGGGKGLKKYAFLIVNIL